MIMNMLKKQYIIQICYLLIKRYIYFLDYVLLSLINFYFDFDKDVEAAAKAYADDESTAGSEEWMKEFYLPYLYDYANDEVLEIVEEIIEDLDVEGEMMAFQMNEKTAGYVQFMVLFNEEGYDVAIEEIVKEYMRKK